MPEALLGMARNLAEDRKTVRRRLSSGPWSVNPNSIEGHLLEASQQLDSEDYAKALATVDKVSGHQSAVHGCPELLSRRFITSADETDEFKQTVEKVLQINPQANGLYYTLARQLRFAAPLQTGRRLCARSGAIESAGLAVDERAWRQPAAHRTRKMKARRCWKACSRPTLMIVPTVNSLRLTDSWKDFDVISTEHFRIKLNKKESAALKPYVTDLLEKAYKTLSAKYEFTPEGPIGFEMYPDHEDFAVRTLGLPGLGALGVCFGKLVVMDSPSARKPDEFNWGSTLWHEFTHVITLQMTDHKIPRWFSEGLSVYEERKAYPGWGDDMKLQYLKAIKGKKLLPIADLNKGFFDNRDSRVLLPGIAGCRLHRRQVGIPGNPEDAASLQGRQGHRRCIQGSVSISALRQFDTEFLKWVDAKAAPINPEQYRKLYVEGSQALEDGDTDKAIKISDQRRRDVSGVFR